MAQKPHYHGHRKRLRERFLKGGSRALADYELLELVLFLAVPRADTKPLAKELIEKFGGYAEVVSADGARLKEVKGIGDSAVIALKLVRESALRLVTAANPQSARDGLLGGRGGLLPRRHGP